MASGNASADLICICICRTHIHIHLVQIFMAQKAFQIELIGDVCRMICACLQFNCSHVQITLADVFGEIQCLDEVLQSSNQWRELPPNGSNH